MSLLSTRQNRTLRPVPSSTRRSVGNERNIVKTAFPTVISADGTAIAFSVVGTGPAVVLVDGALCSRVFGPLTALAARLSDSFTVFTYDRRGRSESGDAGGYAPARETEDLAAVIARDGGSALRLRLSPDGTDRRWSQCRWSQCRCPRSLQHGGDRNSRRVPNANESNAGPVPDESRGWDSGV